MGGGQSQRQSHEDPSQQVCVPDAGQSPDTGGGQRGNSARQDDLGLASGEDTCGPDTVVLPTPVPANGALTYYRSRHNDFTNRYAACGDTFSPPDYYLSYGELYVSRFTNDTGPRLTAEGQAWLARARVNLQAAIELQLAAGPAAFDLLEKDNDGFRAFAYGTHADAYWSAGLGDLNIFDLANMGLTPDVEDLLAFDGLQQVADIGTRLLGVWGSDAIDYVAGDGTAEQLVDIAYEGMNVVGEGIDEVFGEGTASTLVRRAEELGVAATELAEDAHGVASDVVSAGADAIDSVLGEGTTSNAVNSVREVGQDVADGVESGVNWAAEVWDEVDLNPFD